MILTSNASVAVNWNNATRRRYRYLDAVSNFIRVLERERVTL